jgi:thymidylate synthase ThyX
LRNDDHAQWEIREYAKIMQDILTDAFPCLMESFSNHQQNSATLSLEELTLVRSIFNSDWAGTENPVFKIPDVSDREWTTEMLSKLHKVVGTITALRVDTARTKAKGKKVKEG